MSRLQSRLFYRIISRNRELYFLKIITLAIALACTTLVTLFSLNEFGYDRFHDHAESAVRIVQRNAGETFSGNRHSNRIPLKAFTAWQSRAGDSLLLARVKVMDELGIVAEKKDYRHQKIHAADAGIIDIFSFTVLDGSRKDFSGKSRAVMLSATASAKYFGTTRAAGREIRISSLGDTVSFSVVAVFDDFPQNSHEEFDVFVRFDSMAIRTLSFDPGDAGVYGRINHGTLAGNQIAINDLAGDDDFTYFLQPLPEIHFGTRVDGEDAEHGDEYSIIILICITGLILFLALTGFINLTTLTLPYRSKELAIKKLAGTGQRDLIWMFVKESFLLSTLSLLAGVLLVVLTAGFLRQVLPVDLTGLLSNGAIPLILITAGILLLVVIAPLIMIPRFIRATPSRLLSSDTITFPRLKRMITFLQLGISIFLIVASLVIRRQVNYSLLKEPGRNHYQVVHMPYPDGLTLEGLNRIRSGWYKYNPNIVDVMAVSQLPDRINSKETDSDFYTISADPEFINFFDLRRTHGRGFVANDGDSLFMVNQKGSELISMFTPNLIGVVQDLSGQFNQPEKPLKISMASHHSYHYLCVRILEVDIRKTVKYLSTFYDSHSSVPVTFFNKRFEGWLLYQDRLNRLSEVLTLISALLACCSIYGLCLSLVRDKLKEIAIRKMYGATSVNITRILVRAFTRQIIKAVLIFGPLTYLFLKEWLRNFVYVTHFTWIDPIIPVAYCILVIFILCGARAFTIKDADLARAVKG
jgi:putative ABC transport system permease protein